VLGKVGRGERRQGCLPPCVDVDEIVELDYVERRLILVKMRCLRRRFSYFGYSLFLTLPCFVPFADLFLLQYEWDCVYRQD
jgi:hypothetical protein